MIVVLAACMVPAWTARADNRLASSSPGMPAGYVLGAPELPNVLYLPLLLNRTLPLHFSTLPPGAALPDGVACAAAVKSRPENKGVNKTYNATKGNQQLGPDIFSGDDPRAYTEIGVRVDGNFSGTTDEILQWAACKWGIDEDIVRAQAAKESWWRQTTMGDWTDTASACAPGHGINVDDPANHPGQCPESWGLLQDRYQYEKSAFPGAIQSSAFNVDTAYAIWRACYEGYETWLNYDGQYGPGDAWGCIGRWYSGRWHTQPAEDYIAAVKDYLNRRIWESTNFQEP